MGEKIKMRSEGTFIEKMIERFKESFCLILLGTGFVLLFFLIDQSKFYEPTDIQNLILLTIGSFGSYIYLMDLFFDEYRKPIMQKHIISVVVILLFLGALSVINTAFKEIQLENMVEELPLFDSVAYMFLFFYMLIFLFLFMADGIIAFVKILNTTKDDIKDVVNEISNLEEE